MVREKQLRKPRAVPAFSIGSWTSGSPRLERFNANPAVNIQGNAAVGVSSGTAMKAVEEIASKLPSGFSIEWNGVSYQEKMASQAAAPLYALSLLVVFLCLAALYESWTIPISIIPWCRQAYWAHSR